MEEVEGVGVLDIQVVHMKVEEMTVEGVIVDHNMVVVSLKEVVDVGVLMLEVEEQLCSVWMRWLMAYERGLNSRGFLKGHGPCRFGRSGTWSWTHGYTSFLEIDSRKGICTR